MTTDDKDKELIKELTAQIEPAIARHDDPFTSWRGADFANKASHRARFIQHLFDAKAHGKTTCAAAKEDGVPRDYFSPIPSRAKKIIVAIGHRYELNETGNLSKLTVYALRMFVEPQEPEPQEPHPPLLGWQVLRSVQDKR